MFFSEKSNIDVVGKYYNFGVSFFIFDPFEQVQFKRKYFIK